MPGDEAKPAPHTPKISPVIKNISTQPKETPSLSRKKPEVSKENKEEGAIVKEETEAFDEEALQKSWIEFREICQKNGVSDTEMLVLNRTVEKSGENDVLIHLASALETSILERLEQNIVQHFRKSLKNTLILLKRDVSEQEKSRKLYTSKEKYDYMVEQNPALKDLKDRLGLDFEF